MKKPAIDLAISAVGSLSELAKRMQIEPQVIVNWRKRGIPADRVLEIERAVDGKVTRHQMRPDIYPKEREAA